MQHEALLEEKKVMIEIDGSEKSGSGTILRLSIALAAITKQPLHICNIRQNRPQPGLKHQHLEAVITAAKLCNAELKGATLGLKRTLVQATSIIGGNIEAEIQTAGNIPMLLLATLPICLFADNPVHLHVAKGGTDTTHAPTINYCDLYFYQRSSKWELKQDNSAKIWLLPKRNGGSNHDCYA